jgi:hypothetical protein
MSPVLIAASHVQRQVRFEYSAQQNAATNVSRYENELVSKFATKRGL